MDTSIFGKPLDDVEFQDVIDFCNQQIEENLNLDYKRDLSSVAKVMKTAVSFANTNGGWIIVGVDDEDDKPKLPVLGMAYSNDHVQKLTNCMIDTVGPIFKMYTKVVKSQDGTKSFLLIFVPQSGEAPHWMRYNDNNMLFVRVGDRSSGTNSERTASMHELEMLREKRGLAIDFRSRLIDEMDDIYFSSTRVLSEEAFEEREPEYIDAGPIRMPNPRRMYRMPIVNISSMNSHSGSIRVIVAPEFPGESHFAVSELKSVVKYEPISNGFNNLHNQTPDTRGHNVDIYHNGAYTMYEHEEDKYYFFGLDMYGTVEIFDYIEKRREADDGLISIVEVTDIITAIEGTIRFAVKHYESGSLSGNVVIETDFESAFGPCRIYKTNLSDWPYSNSNFPRNITGSFRVSRYTDTFQLSNEESRNSLIADMLEEVLRSFNYDLYTREQLDEAVRRAANPRIAR